MSEFVPYILWGFDNQAEFQSIEEFDQWIDNLTIEAQKNGPFSIQVVASEQTALMITLGRKESHMEYYDEQHRPPIVACRGPWDVDERIAFLHGGESSEIEIRYCVDISVAKEALNIHVLTGKRPKTYTGINDHWTLIEPGH